MRKYIYYFRIYQNGISCKRKETAKREWERFLSDMLDLPETNDNYFLSSVILKKAGTNDFGYEQFDVVDGQQRLTTLVIFSKILYLMAGNDGR